MMKASDGRWFQVADSKNIMHIINFQVGITSFQRTEELYVENKSKFQY